MRAFGLLRLVMVILGSFACIFIIPLNGFGQSCTLSVTPNSGFAPLSVSATGTCNGGLTPFTMDWGDNSQTDPFAGTTTLNHTYTSTGALLATLTAQDANGGTFTVSQQVTVITPVACKLAMNPSQGAVPLKSTATGSCSSVTAAITSVAIDFGDGNTTPPTNGSTITASNTYTQVSRYIATITGTDSNGQTGSRFQFLNVTATPPSLPITPVNGDLYVSGDTGTIEHRSNKGTLIDTLQVEQSLSNTLGAMAFDVNRTLFVADRSGGDDSSFANAYYFDTSGTAQQLTGQFSLAGTGTLVFDNAGNVYLGGFGESSNGPAIQKLDSFARVLFNYAPASSTNGSGAVDWMDLAVDQCTMFYTDGASTIKRFDVCQNIQLADFTTALPGSPASDLRIRPNGEVLVADGGQVVRLDATGQVIQSYGRPSNIYSGVALDPDNTSFWVTKLDGGVIRYDIASGAVLSQFTVNFGAAEGVTIFGEIRAATNTPPTCTLKASPTTGTAPLNVTVTGNCTPGVNPITGTVLDFGDGTTQTAASGTHTYKNAGTFTVKLTATNSFGVTNSASQTVTVSAPPPSTVTPPGLIPTGLFVSFGNGTIKQLATDGSLIRTLTTGLGGTIAGMGFDQFGTLYATDFSAGNVSKFDILGTPLGTFGSAYNCQPESLVFDGAGNAYVGQQGCSRTVLKFGPNGQLLAEFRVLVEKQGVDQIELSADQCTLFYTSEGPSILRFNVCTGQQLAAFATNLTRALTLRILPDGGVLVTDEKDITRLDASGQKVTTYTVAGEQCWDGLTLDPDRTSFWAADFCSSNIYKFDIATGRQLAKLNPGAASGSIFSIAMGGTGLNVGGVGFAGALTASPPAASLSNGQSATFTISFNALQNAVGQTFQLACANLPPSLKCSFSPASITPGSTGPAGSSTLTISAVTTAALLPAHEWIFAASLGVVPGIVLITVRIPRRRRLRALVFLGIVAATFLATSCGGGNKPKPAGATSKGSFTVLVIGNAGQLQASTPINVTVQ